MHYGLNTEDEKMTDVTIKCGISMSLVVGKYKKKIVMKISS